MKLHLLGLPHTVTDPEHSHCAFTGKILRFPEMMKDRGYHIIHYGVEGAQTVADQQITIMSRAEQDQLRGHDGSDKAKFYSDDCNTEFPLYKEFNKRLRKVLMDTVTQSDIVLLPFGHGHQDALNNMPFIKLESGIGYPTLYTGAEFKIFESNAWMHYHQGKANRNGRNYEWVIPNYYKPSDWGIKSQPLPDAPVVYLGRITEQKGVSTVIEVAKRRPDIKFLIVGQGDPKPYLTERNVFYVPAVTHKMRNLLLSNARAVIMPTLFTEPFAGVSVEAQLCGTPVLSTAYGAFTETIEDEVTGFRCHTLGDFLAGLDRVQELDRGYIARRARSLYGYDRVSKMYDRVFQQIADLQGEGWYSSRSVFQRPALKLLAERAG